MKAIHLVFVAALFLVIGVVAEEKVVVIPAGESEEQVILSGEPAGTHFEARGLTLLGGKSARFVPA